MTKDTTIKLRLTADEKANWEAQADADGVTLSSLIRARMNNPVTRADGVLDPAPETEWFLQKEATAAEQAGVSLMHYLVLNGVTPSDTVPPVRQGCPANGKPCNCSGLCKLPAGSPLPAPGVAASADSPERGDQFPRDEHDVAAWAERNQQLDGTKLIGNAIALLGKRRSSKCEHGRPQYVFCPTCDS